MPLVVPGINSSMGDKSDIVNNLVGKRLGDTTDQTTFAKTDLPQSHRVLGPGDMKSMEHDPNRLNIHVNEDKTITEVNYG